MKSDSLCVYALNEGKITEVYAFNYKVEADFISEIKINGDELVFVRFKVDEKKKRKNHILIIF